MSTQRIVGIVLLVGGLVLFLVGCNAADSVMDRISKFFTGHLTDQTVWYMIGGAVAFLVGLSMTSFGNRDTTV